MDDLEMLIFGACHCHCQCIIFSLVYLLRRETLHSQKCILVESIHDAVISSGRASELWKGQDVTATLRHCGKLFWYQYLLV